MLDDIRKRNAIFDAGKEAGMQMSPRQQMYYEDTSLLLSLIDKYKEALNKLDEVIHFDKVEETWMDESLLGVNTGTELSIRQNHIAIIKRLNEAKKFAKSVLEKE